MKVSKDQHLKAERKCLSAAAAEWSVTRDQTPGTIWGYHTSTFFLKIFANMYRERKTWSSRKFGERFFLAKMTFSRWKNLEQPSYIYINIYVLYFVKRGSLLTFTFHSFGRVYLIQRAIKLLIVILRDVPWLLFNWSRHETISWNIVDHSRDTYRE